VRIHILLPNMESDILSTVLSTLHIVVDWPIP